MRFTLHSLFLIFLAVCTPAFAAQQQTGPLRIGLNASLPPFGYVDSYGEMAGFDVEIAKAICARLGLQCELKLMLFEEMLPAIARGELDMLVAGMGENEERKKLLVFSDKYFQSRSIYVTRRNLAQCVMPGNFKGLRLATRRGTLHADYLKKNFSDAAAIKLRRDVDEVFSLIRTGTADVALVEGLSGFYQLKLYHDNDLEVLPEMVTFEESGGIARIAVTRERADLIPHINRVIQQLRQSGEYDRINRTFFDFDIY